MIGSDLLKLNLDKKKFIVFDFECVEGLNLFYGRPHELAWCECERGEVVAEHQFYLKWPKPWNISVKAAEVTRFNEALIDEIGVDPREAFEKFRNVVYNSDYWIVGSNTLNYDIMILYNSLKRLGMDHDYSFLNRCYDINALYKAYKLGRKVNNKELLSFQFCANNFIQKGLKSNVTFMAKEFGIEVDETRTHGAEYDVFVERSIFFELIKKIDLE